jgi:hypothetical protein
MKVIEAFKEKRRQLAVIMVLVGGAWTTWVSLSPGESALAQDSQGGDGASVIDPTEVKPAADPAPVVVGDPEWHRVHMRLIGSMCVACLKDLEVSVQHLPGVNAFHTAHAPVSMISALAPEMNNWVDSVVIYDGKKLPITTLRQFLKRRGYNTYHLEDKVLSHSPSEKDLKL